MLETSPDFVRPRRTFKRGDFLICLSSGRLSCGVTTFLDVNVHGSLMPGDYTPGSEINSTLASISLIRPRDEDVLEIK